MSSSQQLLLCAYCGNPFTDNTSPRTGGRPSLYCKPGCRLNAWRSQQRAKANR